jgi:hypothetical protein
MPQIGSGNNAQCHQAVLQKPTLGVLQKLHRLVLAGALGAVASTQSALVPPGPTGDQGGAMPTRLLRLQQLLRIIPQIA